MKERTYKTLAIIGIIICVSTLISFAFNIPMSVQNLRLYTLVNGFGIILTTLRLWTL